MFSFHHYLSPTWYFRLKPAADIPYFPDWEKITMQDLCIIDFDEGYSSKKVSKLDAAWQAWQKGMILEDPEIALKTEEIKPSLADNYRFVRKYFHPLWSWYVLLLRLLKLNHPVKEVAAFRKEGSTQRENIYQQVNSHEQAWEAFESKLVKKAPLVTVVIPTLNRYEYLKDVLFDLEKQEYSNFDVIVVDQSEPFQPEFYKSFDLHLRVIQQEEKALWLARNTAIQVSHADYLLLFDDDSRVNPDWIASHLKCLDFFKADISSGVSISVVGAKAPKHYTYFRWSDQLDTGNVLIKREVFEKIGLFDRQFEKQRMGDGEFGLRAYLASYKNISNPYAQRVHLKVGTGGLRQMGSWDGFRPKSWLAPRPVPSVLYLARKYFGNRAARYLLLKGVPPSLVPYKYKGNPAVLLLGLPLALFLAPLVGWQIWKSWRLAGRMLREGALISPLTKEVDQLQIHSTQ